MSVWRRGGSLRRVLGARVRCRRAGVGKRPPPPASARCGAGARRASAQWEGVQGRGWRGRGGAALRRIAEYPARTHGQRRSGVPRELPAVARPGAGGGERDDRARGGGGRARSPGRRGASATRAAAALNRGDLTSDRDVSCERAFRMPCRPVRAGPGFGPGRVQDEGGGGGSNAWIKQLRVLRAFRLFRLFGKMGQVGVRAGTGAGGRSRRAGGWGVAWDC